MSTKCKPFPRTYTLSYVQVWYYLPTAVAAALQLQGCCLFRVMQLVYLHGSCLSDSHQFHFAWYDNLLGSCRSYLSFMFSAHSTMYCVGLVILSLACSVHTIWWRDWVLSILSLSVYVQYAQYDDLLGSCRSSLFYVQYTQYDDFLGLLSLVSLYVQYTRYDDFLGLLSLVSLYVQYTQNDSFLGLLSLVSLYVQYTQYGDFLGLLSLVFLLSPQSCLSLCSVYTVWRLSWSLQSCLSSCSVYTVWRLSWSPQSCLSLCSVYTVWRLSWSPQSCLSLCSVYTVWRLSWAPQSCLSSCSVSLCVVLVTVWVKPVLHHNETLPLRLPQISSKSSVGAPRSKAVWSSESQAEVVLNARRRKKSSFELHQTEVVLPHQKKKKGKMVLKVEWSLTKGSFSWKCQRENFRKSGLKGGVVSWPEVPLYLCWNL